MIASIRMNHRLFLIVLLLINVNVQTSEPEIKTSEVFRSASINPWSAVALQVFQAALGVVNPFAMSHRVGVLEKGL